MENKKNLNEDSDTLYIDVDEFFKGKQIDTNIVDDKEEMKDGE